MLLTRVITALALMPLVLGMLFFAPRGWWSLFALMFAMVGAWEWSRLCGFDVLAQRAYVAFSGSIGAALVALYIVSPPQLHPGVAQALLWVSAAFWLIAVPWWLKEQLRPPPWVLGLAGWITLW